MINEYIRKKNVQTIKLYDKSPETTKKWREFLEKLDKDDNIYNQSINKYRCRMFYFDWKYKFLINSVAFLKLLKINFKKAFLKIFNPKQLEVIRNSEEYKATNSGTGYDMVIQSRTDLGIDDVFPNELYEEFLNNIIIPADFNKEFIFNKDLNKIYKKLSRKNFFRFNYKLSALKELAFHSYVIENYNPKAVVVYINERNIYSPFLKDFYESKGKEYISFMHGTNLFSLINSFMSFSRYYIWDKDYQEMFEKEMFCNINKYPLYTPGKLEHRFKPKEKYDKDITYYLSAQDEQSQLVLIKQLNILRERGINLVVRPHPRVSMNKEIYPENSLEDNNVDIIDSVDNTKYVAGVNTTVIEQGYYGGKKVIIDDVTNPKEFESLKSRGYLMLKKLGEDNVELFSEYLNKMK